MAEVGGYVRCNACRGWLEKRAVFHFERLDGHATADARDKAEAVTLPPWADGATRSAPAHRRSQTKQTLLLHSPGGGRDAECHRELFNDDQRYMRLRAMHAMLDELGELQGYADRVAVRVYAHACPHCGERDSTGTIALLLEQDGLIRTLEEADDRPSLHYGEDGKLIDPNDLVPLRAGAVKCGTCHSTVTYARFCEKCGNPLPRLENPPLPPPIPKVVRTERPALLECRTCGTKMTPRAAFEFDILRPNSGYRDDDDVRQQLEDLIAQKEGRPRPEKPDPWVGRNFVRRGGAPAEETRARLAADPIWRERPEAAREREVRRLAAGLVLAQIPQPNYWSGTIVRGLVRPCRACGEADPLGTAKPPSPEG